MNKFISNENKSLLWDMLLKNGLFDNINNDNYGTVQRFFDNTINDINNGFEVEMRETKLNRNQNIDDLLDKTKIIDLNKKVILRMRQNMGAFKSSYSPMNDVPKLNNSINNSMNSGGMDTKDYEKVVVFDKNLTNAKNEFDIMIKPKIPDMPDFGEKEDTPLGVDKMDNMLSRLIAERDNLPLPPPPSQSPVGLSQSPVGLSQVQSLNTNITEVSLKKIENIDELFGISNNDNNSNNSNIVKKKISFLDDEVNSNPIINSNPINNNQKMDNNDIKREISILFEKIREINLKQDKILELLEKTSS